MAIDPIYAVPCLAMIRHLVGWFETERLGNGGTGYAKYLDDHPILRPRKND